MTDNALIQKPVREPASPWGTYRRMPRSCTVCGSREIVKDGTYLCRSHHPDDQNSGDDAVTDVVVTVPKRLWREWIDEGDLPGDEESGEVYAFSLGGPRPLMVAGDRVYIVAHGKLRGYAPLTMITPGYDRGFALCRGGGALACTIDEPIPGFRGWRYRFWSREDEIPFPNWRTP